MSAVLHPTDPQPAKTLHVTRLEPTIGAQISGIDLRQPLTPALRDELRRLLLEHKVIFFRDQAISTEQQIAFAREFGELYVHPTTRQNDPTQPQAHLIQAQDERKLYGPRISGRWHTDTSWLLRPTLGAVLRAIDLPPVGGDTLWADTAAVYRALPDALREEIDDLHVVHDFKSSLDKVGYDYPILAHPLVRTHPETGEDGLFINFSQNPSVIGWPPEKSKQLIDRLLLEFNKPEHQVRFKWREHSVAFWDNRSTLHYPVYNYGDYPRRMERVLIAYDDIPHRARRASAA
ncbi:Alpha-ketoglutarate-dependent taurine dioxygenase [Pseudomonas fluorescens]|uniref:Alpha-ketoglutarate-dependent taurine dioxygenase n=1 Tax=Pseudomonas fluorescens TaxID=294 RepID=A0A5E7SXH5_PSEFL|nr:TauD/TfdA family dioxygenase [Pseudomonas fluorescens]VVP90555.1 Alpha-ketoglutarate-dependent taurine dioxygenase [Pseudomonas fluorescens]